MSHHPIFISTNLQIAHQLASNESFFARVFHRQMDMAERQERHNMERDERERQKEK